MQDIVFPAIQNTKFSIVCETTDIVEPVLKMLSSLILNYSITKGHGVGSAHHMLKTPSSLPDSTSED